MTTPPKPSLPARQGGPRKVAWKGGPQGGLQTEMTIIIIITIIIIVVVVTRPRVEQRADQLSLPHVRIATETERNRTKHKNR